MVFAISILVCIKRSPAPKALSIAMSRFLLVFGCFILEIAAGIDPVFLGEVPGAVAAVGGIAGPGGQGIGMGFPVVAVFVFCGIGGDGARNGSGCVGVKRFAGAGAVVFFIPWPGAVDDGAVFV